MPRREVHVRPVHALQARSFGNAGGFGDIEPGPGDWPPRRRPVDGSREPRHGFGDSAGFGDAGGFDYGVAAVRFLR